MTDPPHRKTNQRDRPYSAHGLPTRRAATRKANAASGPPRTAPARPTTSPVAAPIVTPPVSEVDAADLLMAISALVPVLKRVRETADGTPFDAQQAARLCDHLTYLATGEEPIYRLVRITPGSGAGPAGGGG